MKYKPIIPLILGILSLIFFSWIILCAILSIAAAFLSIKSIKTNKTNTKIETTTIIISSISILYILVYLIIKFSIGFSPLIVYDSCSMYHGSNFESWWNDNKEFYEKNEITKSQFNNFPIKNGFNRGDIIFIWKKESYNLGDVILFNPNPESFAKKPIMHRIISTNPIATKGDRNAQQLNIDNNQLKIDETGIENERILGTALFRMPYLGFTKLAFLDAIKLPEHRGQCK